MDQSVEGGSVDPFDRRPRSLSDVLDDVVVWVERRRRQVPSLALGVATVGLIALGLWWAIRSAPGPPIEDRIPTVALDPTTAPAVAEAAAQPLIVHVAGAVQQPGVYTLDPGRRVIDAVEAAGGARPDADLSLVNLAEPLVDGSQIRIPIVGETPTVPVRPVLPGGATAEGSAAPVDLNRATAAELETLTGVGPATAQAILDWREQNGPFRSIDQLLDVAGIGPAKFERLAGEVTVG